VNAASYFVDRHLEEGRGGRVAIECGDECVTYAQLGDRVNRAGNAFRRLNVRPGDRVALLLLDTPAFAYSLLGAIKLGAVPVPLNTLWKPPDYTYVLNDMQARVAVVSASLAPLLEAIPRKDLPHLEQVVVTGSGSAGTSASPAHPTFDTLLDESAPDLAPAPTSKNDTAIWLYSSGSTGEPKACVHRHRDPVFAARAFGLGVLGVSESDRSFSAAKLFFAYGLGNALFLPLAAGGTSILFPGQPTAASVARIVERYRPTLFYWVPTGYAMLLAHEAERASAIDFSSVRAALSAGEALPPAIFQRFKDRYGIEILDGIGATETMHNVIANPPGAPRPGSSGLVVPGYEASIRAESGVEVPDEEIGNLFVKGESICAEYWNQPEKTRATFQDGWFRTGDKFHRDGDGYYWHHGRSDDMLKVGGMWVSPVDVERALLEHPAVHECAVVGRDDADALVKPVAYVVPAPGAEPGPALAADLQQFALEKLARYKRPRWIEFVTELPKTPTGKIQRYKLRNSSEL
jgi:benzoate-CoA ligase